MLQRPKQSEAFILLPKVFGMMKGMVKSNSRDRAKLAIQFSRDHSLDNIENLIIANIGLRRIAIEISGDLVEQNHESQGADCRPLLIVDRADTGAGQKLAEAYANLFVNGFAASIPPIEPCECGLWPRKARPEPEIDNVGG